MTTAPSSSQGRPGGALWFADDGFGRLEKGLNALCAGVIAILMILGVTQIVARKALGLPIPGYIDIVEQVSAVFAFLGAANCQRLKSGIRDADRVLVTSSQPHPEMAGRDLADIAAAWGCPPAEAARRLHPAGAVYFQMDEGDLLRILAEPNTMIGSDGVPSDHHPHPRLWGTFPRVLGRYAREQGVLTLHEAVHRMTGLPARVFGLRGRGRLAPGAFADVVLFDPGTVIDRATYDHPCQPAEGIACVLVNGRLVWRESAWTGATPGRFLART